MRPSDAENPTSTRSHPSASAPAMARRPALGQVGAVASRRWRNQLSRPRRTARTTTKIGKTSPGSGGAAEADRVAGAGLLTLGLAVLGGRARRQVVEQVLRRVGDRVDGLVEGLLVGLARLRRAADLANVLERRGSHLVTRGRGFEVVELTNVAAHVCQGMPRRGVPRTS